MFDYAPFPHRSMLNLAARAENTFKTDLFFKAASANDFNIDFGGKGEMLNIYTDLAHRPALK